MSEAATGTGARIGRRRTFADWLEHLAMTAPPRPSRGPLFIGDCVTSWGGRPMLLVLEEERGPED